MYQGEHSGRHGKHRARGKRLMTLLASLALLLGLTVGGTLAYLSAKTDEVPNVFTPSKVPNKIVETFDGRTKSDVSVKNTGDTSAYVRVAIIFNWVDEAGNVSGTPVKEGDYALTLNLENGWVEHTDGYYYYKTPVEPGAQTSVLVTSCTENADNRPDGYTLSMEIMGQTVQALGQDSAGEKPVELAWGVDPSTLGQGGN